MDEVNVHIDDLVVDGGLPLSPAAVSLALSRAAPALADQQVASISVAIAESVTASPKD